MTQVIVYVILIASSFLSISSLPGRGDKFNKLSTTEVPTLDPHLIRKTFNYSHKYSTVQTEDVIHPKNVNFTDPLLNNTIYALNKNLSIIPDRSTEKSIIQIRKEKEETLKKVDPKGFMSRNQDNNEISLLCLTTKDCKNTTCCVRDGSVVGKCVLLPYKENQFCNIDCYCTGELECQKDINFEDDLLAPSRCKKKLSEEEKALKKLKIYREDKTNPL